MGIYIHYFETEAGFSDERNNNYVEPWLFYTEVSDRVDYNKSRYERLISTPLTFEIMGTGTIRFKAQDTGYTRTIEYKKNDGEWTSITSSTGNSSSTISVVSGDTVQVRGNNADYSSNNSSDRNYFVVTGCNYNLCGNIMSLVDSTNFETATTFSSRYVFYQLFSGSTGLVSAEDLLLPATSVTMWSYYGMFQYCTNLTKGPELLPATVVSDYGYSSMFSSCTGLLKAPEIAATTVMSGCCSSMFTNCSSMTIGPSILPAETFGYTGRCCYRSMFYNCKSLTVAPILPATGLAASCYTSMFYGCESLVNGPDLPATNTYQYPSGYDLGGCYHAMFSGCTNLRYVKYMSLYKPDTAHTGNWLAGVSETGTFVRNSSATWEGQITRGVSTIPTGWTIETASA